LVLVDEDFVVLDITLGGLYWRAQYTEVRSRELHVVVDDLRHVLSVLVECDLQSRDVGIGYVDKTALIAHTTVGDRLLQGVNYSIFVYVC
jgi:hypothetical protein